MLVEGNCFERERKSAEISLSFGVEEMGGGEGGYSLFMGEHQLKTHLLCEMQHLRVCEKELKKKLDFFFISPLHSLWKAQHFLRDENDKCNEQPKRQPKRCWESRQKLPFATRKFCLAFSLLPT